MKIFFLPLIVLTLVGFTIIEDKLTERLKKIIYDYPNVDMSEYLNKDNYGDGLCYRLSCPLFLITSLP